MRESKNKSEKKYAKIFFFNTAITAFALIALVFALPFLGGKKERKESRAEFSAVNKICELATLRCYYHDVAEYEKQPDGLFQYGLFQYGYKKFWIEYDGIVEIGIDAGRVKVNAPDKDGVVRIYIPEAQILNINADPDSMGELISETGKFTQITAAEKAEAFARAQESMKIHAQNDGSLLMQAHHNAKELLKQYVINVGEEIGQHYTVEWMEDSADRK
ncbi:MAG: DUF4230 domain-containing protein [Johnsonella sp.]|nr:DUF4230 domain-containing protein [Johnsonella sp.]